jgi:hypothetical protein
MRRFVIMTALALALLPAAALAQDPPAQPPAAPAQPAAPKLTFKTEIGMLLVPVKGDQTTAFEEMIAKLRSTAGMSTDPALKAAGTLKVYKSADPGPGGQAFYVLLYDPATQEMYKRFAAAIGQFNILNLTEVK